MKPETAAQVRECIAEIIELDDHDVVLLRSRAAEQEVLDLLMSPQPGEVWLLTLASTANSSCFTSRPLRNPREPIRSKDTAWPQGRG